MRNALVMVLAGMAACGRHPPAQTVAVPSASVVASIPPPAVSAVQSAEAAPPPIPPAPPGADAESVVFVGSICAAATMTIGHSVLVGCRSHPPFTQADQKPDGTIPPFTGDERRFCALERIYRGSFTRPGARQAVLSFAQCMDNGSDEWDSGFPGSAVLVEEIDGRWREVSYEAGVNLPRCLTRRSAEGRDVLVCRSGLAAPPSGGIWYVFLLDFARPGRHAGTLALMYTDTFGCASLGPPTPGALRVPNGLVSLEIGDLRLDSAGDAGTNDVVVDVTRARAAPSATLDARVTAACKLAPNVGGLERSLAPPATKTRLRFVTHGDVIVPTEPSRRALDAWKTEAPDGMNGLTEAAPPPLVE
jgi:hypothetical protein